jgi:hypothetical protein
MAAQQGVEVFAAPIEGVLIALGRGIAEAQRELDRSSLAAQAEIDADPDLAQIGAQATWFQLPRVELELKLALSMSDQPASGRALAPVGILRGLKLIAQPLNAAYQNHFNYDLRGSSVVKVTVVPVPAPTPRDAATAPPRQEPAAVQRAALASKAGFATVKRGDTRVPNPKLRLDVNFNAATRTWSVLQYDPARPDRPAVAAVVDDETATVRVVGG